MRIRFPFVLSAVLLLFSGVVEAAPALRVNTANLRPIWVQQGTNGPATPAFFETYNAGDGNLSLQVQGSHPWLTPALGSARTCAFDPSKTCIPVNVALNSASLAAGAYSGVVTLTDSNAFDAPQTVRVTVYVSGNVPARFDFYLPPDSGANTSASFQTPAGPAPVLRPTTQTGGNWLAVSISGSGSFQFLYTHKVQATVQGGQGAGDYNGSVAVSNSSFSADNKTAPVTLHVTTSPIALGPQQLRLRAVQGAAAIEQPVGLANGGRGTLTASGATASGGSWLTASVGTNGAVQAKADPTGLSPGFYNGAISIASNAANSPIEVPVEFEVQAASAPISDFGGVVDAASFLTPVGGGALVALFGSQLATGVASAPSIPLPTTLADATVFVNDAAAPLIFVSPGQINFQMPFNVSGQARVRVDRQGQRGNTVTVTVATRGAGLFTFGGTYGIVVNASRGNAFAWPDIPALAGVPKAAAHPGDVLVMYGSGFGPVNPAVATGAAAGADPVSNVVDKPVVAFGRAIIVPRAEPSFVGLTPGFVGLYQVNVQVPKEAPNGNAVPLVLAFPDGSFSNGAEIAIVNP